MNVWKTAFFGLIAVILITVGALYFALTANVRASTPSEPVALPEGLGFTVQTTTADLQRVATYLTTTTFSDLGIPLNVTVGDTLRIDTEVDTFIGAIDVSMAFEPSVDDYGNIILQQKNMHAGKLPIAPSIALGVLQRFSDLPPWLVVYPRQETMYIDLTQLPIEGGLRIKGKSINLAQDEIVLEITVPEE